MHQTSSIAIGWGLRVCTQPRPSPNTKAQLPLPIVSRHQHSAMAEAFWFRAFLMASLLLLLPLYYGIMAEGFQKAEMEYSVEHKQGGAGKEMLQFQMSAARPRRLLMMGGMLDYDDTGANSKHDPRKKPGKP